MDPRDMIAAFAASFMRYSKPTNSGTPLLGQASLQQYWGKGAITAWAAVAPCVERKNSGDSGIYELGPQRRLGRARDVGLSQAVKPRTRQVHSERFQQTRFAGRG